MSRASLSLKNLTNALREVDDWEDLGIQLDIQYHELQKFVSEHQKTDERKRAMLQFWLDHETKASWEIVISALLEMKLNRIAEEIKTKYQMSPNTQSEDVTPLVATVTAEPENITTADLPSAPPTDQLEQALTTQCENVTAIDLNSSLAPSTEQTKETSTEGVRKGTATLEAMYDDLVRKAGVFFSKRQALSSDFFVEFQISVAVLPTSLKYQHEYFLERHSSEIAKATTVGEIFSILNRYCNFLNCSLLAHIISKFGDGELQRQLSRVHNSFAIISFTNKDHPFCPDLHKQPKTCTRMCRCKSQNGIRVGTLHTILAYISSLTDYVLYLERGAPGSIYLLWSLPKHAIEFLAAAMNSEFLQHHCIEEVTIDGMDLEEYKRHHYIHPGQQFDVIGQHVDELSEGLVWASREGCLEDVVFLLSTGVKVNSRGQRGGSTALMWASKGGCLDVVKELLRAQAGVDMQDETGLTALMKASSRGHTDVVQLLLSSGAQVDLQEKRGRTALMRASFSGRTDVVQLLLSSGAQVDLQDMRGRTALMRASFSGCTDVVQLLLSSGAQVDLQDMIGWTALMEASSSGDTDVVQLLLSSGAQVDLQDKFGWTALMWASVRGCTDVVQLLLSSGALVDLQTEDGLTALIHAVKPQIYFFKHDETGTVNALLAAGADVNHQEKTSGRSAVFYGAEEGDLEVVKLLIQGGANLSLKDKDGVNADQVAEVQGHHAVCEELRKHMHGDRRPLSKTVRDRVLATGQFLRALYKRLEERILRTQKKELGRRTQDLDPEITLPSPPRRKGVRDPRGPRQQEENVPGHVH